MPILRNAKHEKVAQALADGLSQEKAYISAGFAAKNARTGASKLLRREANILQRRDEVLAHREILRNRGEVRAAEKAEVSREYVIRNLKEVADRCLQVAPVLSRKGEQIITSTRLGELAAAFQFDPSGANRALELLGKDLGMFIERQEHGKPNEFKDTTDRTERQAAVESKLFRLGVVKAIKPVKDDDKAA